MYGRTRRVSVTAAATSTLAPQPDDVDARTAWRVTEGTALVWSTRPMTTPEPQAPLPPLGGLDAQMLVRWHTHNNGNGVVRPLGLS